MEDLSKFVITNEGILENLNIAIDKVIEKKNGSKLNYDFLEKILGLMLRNSRGINVGKISKIVPVKKDEIFTVVLDFFKSTDEDFYRKAKDTILHKDKYIDMNIYNFHDVKDFNKRNDNNFIEYTNDGMVQYKNGLAQVNIPTKMRLYQKEKKVLDKDTYVLDDIYTIVHEISHLFDLNLESQRTIANRNRAIEINRNRRLTSEATSIAFEGLLTEYLLQNNLYSKEGIQQIERKRAHDTIKDAILTYTKLKFAKEKSKHKIITSEYLEEFMKNHNLSPQAIKGISYDIINVNGEMLFQIKYAIGGLIAPTIIKTYKEKGATALKEYLEYMKNGDLDNALRTIGVEKNYQGICTLNKNYYNQLQALDEKER